MPKPNILSSEKCFEIVKKKLCLNSMDNFYCVYQFEPRSKFEGFLGQYYNLKVVLQNKQSKKTKHLNFFIKLYPSAGPQYDFVKEGECFETERSLYTKIFPKLLSPIEKQNIPQCFLGIENHAIVLEDMIGYKVFDKLDFLPLEHCSIVLQFLARFHARSIIFEEKSKTTVLRFCHRENISINLCDATFQSTLDYFSNNLILMMDFLTEIDNETRERYKVRIMKLASQHFKKTSPLTNERNVLCHGDLWTNNVLFKYDENDKVKKCCVVDFQISRYCSPAYDLLYFLYCTTSRLFRKEQINNLLIIYYETLTASLKEAKLNTISILSLDNLKRSLSELQISCMIQAFATMTVSLLGWEASIQRTEKLTPLSKIVCNEFLTVQKYKHRMIDNLLDLCCNLDDIMIE